MLWAIWMTSILLSAISLIMMVALILRRLVLQQRTAVRDGQRQRLQKALITFSDTRDVEALQTVLRSTPPAVTLEAGFEFLALLRGEEHGRIIAAFTDAGLVEQAIGLLRRGNKVERIRAAEMLGAFANTEGTEALLAALDSEKTDDVLIAIAIALSQLGRLPPLAQIFARMSDTGKRSRRITDLFGQLPAERMVELKDLAAERREPAFARAAAIEALGESGDPALLDFMRSRGYETSLEVAAAAIRALGRIGHPAASDVVIWAMRQIEHDDLRSEAAQAAGRIGAADFIGPLATLLGDDIWTVRYAAGRALCAVPGGMELLRKLAQGSASRNQRMASLVLSEGEIKC